MAPYNYSPGLGSSLALHSVSECPGCEGVWVEAVGRGKTRGAPRKRPGCCSQLHLDAPSCRFVQERLITFALHYGLSLLGFILAN